jgi:hypothetical protein
MSGRVILAAGLLFALHYAQAASPPSQSKISVHLLSAFVLESAASVTGSWSRVVTQTNPYPIDPADPRRFYRLRQ